MSGSAIAPQPSVERAAARESPFRGELVARLRDRIAGALPFELFCKCFDFASSNRSLPLSIRLLALRRIGDDLHFHFLRFDDLHDRLLRFNRATGLVGFPAAAMTAPTFSVAAFNGSRNKWAYRFVVSGFE